MELVMPNNYVVLEEEEMMYLDGGEIATATVLGIISAAVAAGGAAYGAGLAAGTRVYYAGLRNSQYQKIKWQVRAAALVVGNVWGGIFMTGFKNAFYAKVTGK
ncbi:TPA: hypothetical protein U1673_000133 [Streptococcus suis]|uniref:hypothetical protein n=1 Tax=Streptococcus suis TaxID=1307 RepID=UPI0005CCE243|nr:hypothetical protein [Streptococcus suis]MCB2938713.1 hypothetical protein [Streptococcus suis]MDX5051389.1 hypothetical protein [Streptococcus suis]NQG24531.1 hypothetical protein [Streptococcus suis]NQG50390.1 hypothetical protein [Streptococcus suis]NQQ34222.1 hypothetical protein [Streptococcus suis]